MKKKKLLPLVCAGLCGAALTAVLMTGLFVWLLGGFENMSRASKFAAVLDILEDSYIGDHDPDALTDAALSAVVDDLDPWSYYMDAETYQAYLDYSANQYQGIGVTIQKDEQSGGFRIVELEPEGPAARAGVLPGEIILACDGQDVTGGDINGLKAMIQAAYGKSVILTLQGEDGSTREVEVSCEVVKAIPVTAELLQGNVGYVEDPVASKLHFFASKNSFSISRVSFSEYRNDGTRIKSQSILCSAISSSKSAIALSLALAYFNAVSNENLSLISL